MKTIITQHLSRKISAVLLFLVALGLTSGAGAITPNYVGTGTSYYGSTAYAPASPLGFYYSTNRQQYLYKATELLAAGMTAGTPIHYLGFFVAQLQNSNLD